MKRLWFVLLVVVAAMPMAARATDFSLKEREAGPAHPRMSYWWKFDGAAWELTPPEKYVLYGGGEIRLQKSDDPSVAAICRATSTTERDLLVTKKDDKARAAYFQSQLPGGVEDARLESQRDNPLPVNGLMNFEAVYTYKLGGVSYRAAYMVSRALPDDAPTDKTKAAPAASASVGEYFTTVVVAPESSQPDLYAAFQQLLATAKIKSTPPERDNSGLVESHGMLGR